MLRNSARINEDATIKLFDFLSQQATGVMKMKCSLVAPYEFFKLDKT